MKKLTSSARAARAARREWIAFISLSLFVLFLHSQFQAKAAEYRKANPKIENVQPQILKAVSVARAAQTH
jgi:hypothetical protein